MLGGACMAVSASAISARMTVAVTDRGLPSRNDRKSRVVS